MRTIAPPGLPHVVGTPRGRRAGLREGNAGFFVGIGKTQSRQVHPDRCARPRDLARSASSTPMRRTSAPRSSRAADRPGIQRRAWHHRRRDRFIIRTNADGAEDFKIVTAPLGARAGAPGAISSPHRARPLISRLPSIATIWSGSSAVGPAAHRRAPSADGRGARDRIRRGGLALGMLDGYEYDTDDAPLHLPVADHAARVFDYDMATPHADAAQDPGDPVRPRPGRYVTRRALRARARRRDGADHRPDRKDTPLDGSAPLLLYGYGAYGIAMQPPSRTRTCRSSTAAGSGPPPTSAAARTRAGAGSWTGGNEKKPNTLHRLHRLRRAPDRAAATPRRAHRRPTAARPAAC